MWGFSFLLLPLQGHIPRRRRGNCGGLRCFCWINFRRLGFYCRSSGALKGKQGRPITRSATRKHPEAKSRKKPRESEQMEPREKEVADSVPTVSGVVVQSKTGITSPSLLCCLIWNRPSDTLKVESDAFHLPTWTKVRKVQELCSKQARMRQKPAHKGVRCGKKKAGRRRVVVQTTLAASLGLVTGAPAATPAGDGTVGLTWEVGAVYKHAATDYISRQG